jgi:hypothetical protein
MWDEKVFVGVDDEFSRDTEMCSFPSLPVPMLGMELRPSACLASTLPLSHTPSPWGSNQKLSFYLDKSHDVTSSKDDTLDPFKMLRLTERALPSPPRQSPAGPSSQGTARQASEEQAVRASVWVATLRTDGRT